MPNNYTSHIAGPFVFCGNVTNNEDTFIAENTAASRYTLQEAFSTWTTFENERYEVCKEWFRKSHNQKLKNRQNRTHAYRSSLKLWAGNCNHITSEKLFRQHPLGFEGVV